MTLSVKRAAPGKGCLIVVCRAFMRGKFRCTPFGFLPSDSVAYFLEGSLYQIFRQPNQITFYDSEFIFHYTLQWRQP